MKKSKMIKVVSGILQCSILTILIPLIFHFLNSNSVTQLWSKGIHM